MQNSIALGKVEDWRGNRRGGESLLAVAVAFCRCLSPFLGPVSRLRHSARRMQLSCTTRSYTLRHQSYATYQAGAAFVVGRYVTRHASNSAHAF